MTEHESISEEDRARRAEAIGRTVAKMEQARAAGFKELGFDMMNWFARNQAYDCGTAACIAGWVVHANSNLEIPDLVEIGRGRDDGIPERARQILRLGKADAGKLFFAEATGLAGLAFANVTIEHAILVLENLKESGEISWSVIPDMEDLLE